MGRLRAARQWQADLEMIGVAPMSQRATNAPIYTAFPAKAGIH